MNFDTFIPMILHDRQAERVELERLVNGARDGLSGALVLRGAAGIGKTALLDHTVEAAADLQITVVAGVEAEQELGFAALHRLLLPFLGELGGLPAPQRHALETAFGMLAAPAPDRFLVGLAALTLLAGAAAERPLLAVCDDAQWVDRESLEVLAFVGRRLHAERIVLLFGVRDDDTVLASLSGLAELHVGGLPERDALALLTATIDGDLDRVVAARIVAETGGNPLAVREFARGVTAGDQLPFGGPRQLSHRLEARFLSQVRDLGSLTQTVLLVAAADATGDQHLVRQAVTLLVPGSEDAVDAAVEEAERSEHLYGGLRFRHPLIRSAVYGGATRAQRRRVHAALAAVTDPATDADQRAWHLASAAEGPDERVAAELEASAVRARERGGCLAQAALLHRAAELTAIGPRRNARLLAACGAALTAGAPHRAEELLDCLTADLGVPALDAQAMRLRGLLSVMLGRDGAVGLLLDAARILTKIDVEAARDTLLEALDASIVVAGSEEGASTLRVAQAALELPRVSSEPAVADRLLAAQATQVAVGYVPAVPRLSEALAAMRADAAEDGDAARWSLLCMITALDLWDGVALGACAQDYAASARRNGALRALLSALHGLATWELPRGHFAAAEAHFEEYVEVAKAIGTFPHFARPRHVMLHALRGEEAETMAAVAEQIGPGGDRRGGLSVQLARTALTVLHLGYGRYAEAQAAGDVIYEENPPHYGSLVLPDLVEAAVRNNDVAMAERALARLAERATASGTPWALGLLARSRALLADDEALYLEAIERLGSASLTTELARARLLYGEWLRRRRRRSDACDQLRIAYDLFATMGATAFAERTRLELRAGGERARARAVSSSHDLTPQEIRIARLAAGGATNQEIATALFISANTVEYHLRKVFRKLAIRSRRQLGRALPD